MSDMKYNFFSQESKSLHIWFTLWDADIKPAVKNMLACLDGCKDLPENMSFTNTVPTMDVDAETDEPVLVVEYETTCRGETETDTVAVPLQLFNESLFAEDRTDMTKVRELYEGWVNKKMEIRKAKNRIVAEKRKATAKKRKDEKETKERAQLAALIKKYGIPEQDGQK